MVDTDEALLQAVVAVDIDIDDFKRRQRSRHLDTAEGTHKFARATAGLAEKIECGEAS